MSSTYISKSQTASNKQKFTYSVWVKKNSATAECVLLNAYSNSTNYSKIQIDSDSRFHYDDYQGTQEGRKSSTAKLRDVNGWYHLVAVWDTNNSTADDRMIIYINGERVSAFDHSTNPSSGTNSYINDSARNLYIGRKENNSVSANMTLSHAHFCDGYAYAPSDFGETDSTTGEWKIKTSPSVSYGTNGFWIFKDGNTITDSSPNSNNFTLGAGTLTKTEDCPSNVFATGNPLAIKNSPIFTNGNNTITALGSSPYDVTTLGTLGMSSGKFYYEVKWRYGGNQNNQAFTTGITASNQPLATNMSSGSYNNVWFNLNGGDLKKNNSDVGTDYPISVNSIVGFAWDLDNGTLKIHENGTYKNSGNAVVTGIPSDTYLPFFSPNGGTTTSICDLNFGNGYFGSTQISSAGTNASGNGIFEYDVPTGYTALSTKGLNL